MARPAKFLKYLSTNWERVLFVLVGGACLSFAFYFIYRGQVAAGSALYGMGFFSFFYANLARFKRFKGLGFEAELWENKQKEAASLIDRLKGIVATYTREIIMGSVMRGRFSDGASWKEQWKLFDDLSGKHSELGQDIDFTGLKAEMDYVFIFDICNPLTNQVRKAIDDGRNKAAKKIAEQFGPVVADSEGHNAAHAKLREVHYDPHDLYERLKNHNVAQEALDAVAAARQKLGLNFSVDVNVDPLVLDRLGAMAKLIENRPVAVTPELLEWSAWRGKDF